MLESAELEPIKAAVVTSTLDGIVMIDEQGHVLALNPAAESMFGFSRAEAVGRPIAELIVPEHLREAHSRGLAAYVAGGEAKVIGKRVEIDALHKDGRIFPVELSVLEINVEGRRLFSATIRDRSKDAAQEDELEQMRHQLELAVAGAQLGVWSYNPRTGISWYSDHAKEIVGLEENFLPDGEAFRQRVHPEDRDQLVFDRKDDFPEGPVAKEYRIVRPDGETRWVHSLGSAERDEYGTVEAIHGILIDVTERKKSEEELESTRHQLAVAVEGAKLGIWSYNIETGAAWFSDRARDLLGLGSNHLADARQFRAVVHPEDWDEIIAPQFEHFPVEPRGIEYRVVGPDGKVRWIYSLGAVSRDDKNAVEAVNGVIFDITDRKQAEDELESTRHHLELAVEGANLGVWSLNPATGASWFSDRARDLIGLDSNVVAEPRDYKKHVHPDDWDELFKPYADDLPDKPFGIEYRIVRPDGEIRWVYGLGAPAFDEDGDAEAIHGILLDVTDRKASEEELELMRRRLELAMQGAKLGVWSFDPRKGSLWCSDHSKAMLGLPDNLLPNARDLEKHIHPDDWEALSAPYYGTYPDVPLAMEFRVPLAGGGNRWIYALGAAVRDDDGQLETIHGIHLDVSDRKQADEELELIRRRLELAMNGAKIGVWSYNPETGSVWYSDRSREIYALEGDQPLDTRTLRSRVHPDDWARLSAPYYHGFPEEPVEIEYRVVHPNGDVRWIYALGAAARSRDGIAHAVHGIHIDVTDRKRAEEELGRSRDALLQSEKLAALGALLAGVSHELNNPLAAIVGQAEMLAEDSAGTEFETRATRIGAAAERCARIVQTFLTMARQGERQMAVVNLNEVIDTALDLTDYSLRTSGVAVRVNFGSGLPPVMGDRDQLHQVLVNLIVNAQQAMEKGAAFEKVLTIRTSINQAGRVLIDVTDTGPGVPEEMRHRIFEPFFTTKRQTSGGGTGIGLSFSQGIVTAHGGTIVVEPSRRGAHFRIELPAAAGEPITIIPRQEVVIPDVMPSRRRCLVVEDEIDVAETLRELIEREGFEVTLASNGTEAFFALDKGEFDLLFSDLRMPMLNGPELYERLQEIRPELVQHMCFVTGDTMGDSMGEFLRNCGRPVLEKPFTKAGIRAVLAALVDKV
jgi:PAS domain S-box-containing protein